MHEMNRLFAIQKRCARLILDRKFNEPHEDLFAQLHWFPIHSRFKYRKSLLVFQSIKKLLPDLFTKVSVTVHRTTRSSNILVIYCTFPKIELFKRSFAYSGAVLFNQLDNVLKQANSVNTFKKLYFSDAP